MLEGLHLIHFPQGTKPSHLKLYEGMPLVTCQRTLVAQFKLGVSPWPLELTQGAEYFKGKDAYQFLLEVLCGLKSKMLGENEIVGQFKEAYRQYLAAPVRNASLMEILEKLSKDAKEIRTKHLMTIGQQSYSGLSRKIIQSAFNTQLPVLILGSGTLAKDMVRTLNKHRTLFLCARNQERTCELKTDFPELTLLDWHHDKKLWATYPHIINTIGSDETLFTPDFFKAWKMAHGGHAMFIDLGKPSVINTDYNRDDGVYRLSDVFSFGNELTDLKLLQISKAKSAITDLANRRVKTFSYDLALGWEDIQLAY